ncbi:MAG: hypothetical protein K0S23_1158 [Fluviicola sp.]|jgi:hypothetical protein|nr:hypothetical protein [Fluviicola sp.]
MTVADFTVATSQGGVSMLYLCFIHTISILYPCFIDDTAWIKEIVYIPRLFRLDQSRSNK